MCYPGGLKADFPYPWNLLLEWSNVSVEEESGATSINISSMKQIEKCILVEPKVTCEEWTKSQWERYILKQ